MRLICQIKGDPRVKRLMIDEVEDGAFLHMYDIEEDGDCFESFWFEDIEDAMEIVLEEYGVAEEEWQEIPDPPEHCQHDWIAPARIPGRESGNPQWGKLEVLKEGEWVRIRD